MRAPSVAFFLALLLLGGCATAPSRPDWVEGTDSRYPDARYLSGRGQGPTQAEARERARADLAKVFEVRIAERSEDVSEYTGKRAGEESQERLETRAWRSISTRTEQIVAGIRIAEAWRDPETGMHHALAVLERRQAGNLLRQTITGLDTETGQYIDLASRDEDLIHRIGAAARAVQAQEARGRYQRLLQIVDPSGTGIPPVHDAARLAAGLQGLLGRLRIAPRAGSDPLGNLEALLAGALAHAGFTQVPEGQADYVLEGRLQLEDIDDDGWHWLRGSLEVVLSESRGGAVKGSRRWPIKVTGQQPDVACGRAADAVDRVLKAELRETVIGFGGP